VIISETLAQAQVDDGRQRFKKEKTYLDAIQDALARIVRGGRNLGLGRNRASADIDEQEVRKRAPDVNSVFM
jgi:hypothetical protein